MNLNNGEREQISTNPEAPEKWLKQKRPDRKVHPWFLLGGLLMLATILIPKFPYAHYTFKKNYYVLYGSAFLQGRTVCGGKAVITTSIPVVLILAGALGLILAGLLLKVLGYKKAAVIAAVSSIVATVANIYLATTLGSLLDAAKKVGVGYGSIMALTVSFVLVAVSLYTLYKMKVISALDFMALPGMMYFVINNYIPMIGIAIAFKKIDYSAGIFNSPWVGFANFKQLFATSTGNLFDSDAWTITRNTLLYNIAFIILGTLLGIAVGICLSELISRGLQKFFQTSILLPQLISYVIVAYIVYAFFSNGSGFVNHLLGENKAVNFYAETKYWPFILIFVYLWKIIGYNAIIFLSSIIGIDLTIYEAAKVDGCTKLQTIRLITLPLLKPTVITLTLLSVGRIMYSDFGLFYQVPMDSGALYPVTNTIDTYVYRCLMTLNNISTSSAAGLYQAVIGFILVITVNMVVRRADKENALF